MKRFIQIACTFAAMTALSTGAFADVLVKQRVTMGGMKMQSTKMIKGSRERTETKTEFDDPAASALYPQVATITQCDLKRKVQLSERKPERRRLRVDVCRHRGGGFTRDCDVGRRRRFADAQAEGCVTSCGPHRNRALSDGR